MACAGADRPHLPEIPRQAAQAILDEQGLRAEREGRPRTVYSLRHTYICLRLMEGAEIYQIAKNCRTSVEMIEKYYAAHIKNQIDAAAVHRGIQPKETKKPAKAAKPLSDEDEI